MHKKNLLELKNKFRVVEDTMSTIQSVTSLYTPLPDLWTDLSWVQLLPMGRSTLEHAVTPSLVGHQLWVYVVSLGPGKHDVFWIRPVGYKALTTMWYTAGGVQWLQGLLRLSVTLPDPVAMDQGRQWWWPEVVVYAHLATAINFRCLCSGKSQLRHTCSSRCYGRQQRSGQSTLAASGKPWLCVCSLVFGHSPLRHVQCNGGQS